MDFYAHFPLTSAYYLVAKLHHKIGSKSSSMHFELDFRSNWKSMNCWILNQNVKNDAETLNLSHTHSISTHCDDKWRVGSSPFHFFGILLQQKTIIATLAVCANELGNILCP